MFEQTSKNLDDALRRHAGCVAGFGYTEQAFWILLLQQ